MQRRKVKSSINILDGGKGLKINSKLRLANPTLWLGEIEME